MNFIKTTLQSGLRLVTIPMRDNPAVTVLVMSEVGSKYENRDNNGISHFLEHMVFKGSEKRPKASDISRELDSIGAHYNAFTAQEFTGYYAKADKKHIGSILDIVSDMYLNPLFDEHEVQKEKGVIIEEIRMYNDLPQKKVQDEFLALLYDGQPAGMNIAGTEENVRMFTREQLADYRQKYYVAKGTTVIVAGAFDEKTIAGKVEQAFAGIPDDPKPGKAPVIEAQTAPRSRTLFKETDQAHIIIGMRTFGVNDPRIPAVNLLATILGRGMSSRLFSKMRDQLGICYYIKADHEAFTDHGVLTTVAGLDNSRIDEGIKGIMEECKRLKDESVSGEELRKAKDYIAGTTMLELETSDARAEFCGFQEAIKGRIEDPNELIDKINAVTADDIRALARQVCVNEGLNMAMIGRFKDDSNFRKHFSL
ncbi:insulinase family protein [Patescibacteria group bacterium]|nr:insulinase family protein [Patescibacteria group bacterium]MDE1946414.1 insulinase family protein [Patescibacteria group bacterium]MDE2011023.1 insulinase family protein [Patescibacteria group bacterium]MDE2233480.1 insulinase family protein [Patescibacteria group bacterium]